MKNIIMILLVGITCVSFANSQESEYYFFTAISEGEEIYVTPIFTVKCNVEDIADCINDLEAKFVDHTKASGNAAFNIPAGRFFDCISKAEAEQERVLKYYQNILKQNTALCDDFIWSCID